MQRDLQGKLAVLYEGACDINPYQQLAARLGIPLLREVDFDKIPAVQFYLSWQDGCLSLIDQESMSKLIPFMVRQAHHERNQPITVCPESVEELNQGFHKNHNKKSGLTVEIEHRQGEQRSWPIAKQGALAQALGRKTQSIVDATAGWGQDSLAMFRMGYQVTSIERNPIMAELLADAYQRLAQQDWVQQLHLLPPQLMQGEAIQVLNELAEKPDCIYLDPMFPPKRKPSALAKKSVMILRDLVGDDLDKDQLFAAAMQNTAKRVVVKSPDYAEPLGGKPNESFKGKLLRYDVYFNH
jgi:16S rRNA (guanine1516-N2)-methyltransferase